MMLDNDIPGGRSSLTERLSRWGLRPRLRTVVIAEAVAAVVIWFVPWPQWWVPPVVAVVMLLLAVVAYRGATLCGWLARAARFRRHRRAKARRRRAEIPRPHPVELSGIGTTTGIRWDGDYAVTMIALHGHAYAPTFLDPSGAKTEDTAALSVVAGLLEQFGGIELAAVDVVSAGRRTAAAAYAPIYDEIIGDRPAVGLRQTWLVLRLCPQACLAAMAYRADAGAAAAAATERIRQALVRVGCRAVTCTPDQMTAATATLLDGTDLGAIGERWRHVDSGGDFITSYRVAGADLDSDWVNDVWAVKSQLTVLTVRLAATVAGVATVSALVRFHTAAPLTHPPVLTLQSVPGQAFDALLASLPLGNRSLELALSARCLDAGDVELPVAPAGLMIGTTSRTGLPLLLALHDPLKLTRVGLAADLSVVQQLVLRATATGSTVLVHTDRHEAWRPICGEHIWLDDHPGVAAAPPITMVVLDGEDVQSPAMAVGERGHTIVSVGTSAAEDSDVMLTQISQGELVMRTPRVPNAVLTILRPRNETQFLAHLRDPRLAVTP